MNTARTLEIPGPAPLAGLQVVKPSTLPIMAAARKRGETKIAQAPVMNSLAKLIRGRMSELGLTYDDVAKRGGFSTHTTVYALATKREHRQPPRPETLERLAAGLDLPLDLIRQAASEAAGYRIVDVSEIAVPLEVSEDVRVVIAAMSELSAADRRKIRALTMEFLKDLRGQT